MSEDQTRYGTQEPIMMIRLHTPKDVMTDRLLMIDGYQVVLKMRDRKQIAEELRALADLVEENPV